jgi:hypothetical protein
MTLKNQDFFELGNFLGDGMIELVYYIVSTWVLNFIVSAGQVGGSFHGTEMVGVCFFLKNC